MDIVTNWQHYSNKVLFTYLTLNVFLAGEVEFMRQDENLWKKIGELNLVNVETPSECVVFVERF